MPTSRSTRRARFEDMTRDSVRDAVIKVLAAGGSSSLTMERVAAEAGMAKATLYGYFRSKKQLLEWVREASFAPLREQDRALFEADIPPDEKLRRFVRLHLTYFDRNRGVFRVLIAERLTSSDAHHRRRDRFRLLHEALAAILRDGARIGVFRRLDEPKVAIMLMDAVIALNRQRLMSESPAPVDEDAQALLDFLFHGIGAGSCVTKRAPHEKRSA